MSEPNGRGAAWGPVTVLGAHILDVLGRPVEAIPPGQGSARLQEIRATAAGTAAGAGVDLAKLGARVLAVGALGDDLLGDIVVAAMARHGVDTSGLSRKRGVQTSATILPIRANGERPALHVPGATSLLELADVDLDLLRRSRALLTAGMLAGLLLGAAAADPGRRRRLPRRRAVVHATAGRHDAGGPGPPGLLHLQRPRQRAAGRRRGR